MIAKMRNGGEACTAANRLYVQAGWQALTAALTTRMNALTTGPGLDDGINVGPLVNAESRDKVAELVDDAIAKGATATTGGVTPDGTGWFYPPTVLTHVPDDALILREEIFGPVAPIVVFDTEDQAIELANDTEYGLVAYLYTQDLARGLRVSERLESGMIGLNRALVPPRRPLRRRQAIRPRPRRRPRRPPRIPRKQIHRPDVVADPDAGSGRSEAPVSPSGLREQLGVVLQLDAGAPDVEAGEVLGLDKVAAADRVEEEGVLGVDDPAALGTGDHHEDSAVVLGGVPQPGDGADELVAVAAAVGQQVELAIELEEVCQVAVVLDACLDVGEPVELRVVEPRMLSTSARGSSRSRGTLASTDHQGSVRVAG